MTSLNITIMNFSSINASPIKKELSLSGKCSRKIAALIREVRKESMLGLGLLEKKFNIQMKKSSQALYVSSLELRSNFRTHNFAELNADLMSIPLSVLDDCEQEDDLPEGVYLIEELNQVDGCATLRNLLGDGEGNSDGGWDSRHARSAGDVEFGKTDFGRNEEETDQRDTYVPSIEDRPFSFKKNPVNWDHVMGQSRAQEEIMNELFWRIKDAWTTEELYEVCKEARRRAYYNVQRNQGKLYEVKTVETEIIDTDTAEVIVTSEEVVRKFPVGLSKARWQRVVTSATKKASRFLRRDACEMGKPWAIYALQEYDNTKVDSGPIDALDACRTGFFKAEKVAYEEPVFKIMRDEITERIGMPSLVCHDPEFFSSN